MQPLFIALGWLAVKRLGSGLMLYQDVKGELSVIDMSLDGTKLLCLQP